MKDEKQKTPKDKNGKLSTYVVVMLLSIIIVIIIAAMADDREQQFQSQIESTTQANMTIQNEIVTLKDENYVLTQENEKLKSQVDNLSTENAIFCTLNEVLKLFEEEEKEEAVQKFSEINPDAVPDACKKLYESVKATVMSEDEQ